MSPSTGHEVVTFTVPVEPSAPTVVRHRVRSFDRLADGMRPDFELLLTEIVSNVVRHSGLGPSDDMKIRVQLEPGRCRADVTDPVATSPVPKAPPHPPQDEASSGYGLYLVDRIASRWGAHVNDGTTVWFELDEDDRRGVAS